MYIIPMPQEPFVAIEIPERNSHVIGIGLTIRSTRKCIGVYDISVKDRLTRDDITRMMALLHEDLLEPLQRRQCNVYDVHHTLSELFGESATVRIDENILYRTMDEVMEVIPTDVYLHVLAWRVGEHPFDLVEFNQENQNSQLQTMFENIGIL